MKISLAKALLISWLPVLLLLSGWKNRVREQFPLIFESIPL